MVSINMIPPKNPSQDFFGEIEGANLFLPNLTPIKYANESYTHVKIKIINTKFLLNSWTSNKGKATKKISEKTFFFILIISYIEINKRIIKRIWNEVSEK